MTPYDTVIFDLDGTLLDTLDDLADSVNAALVSCGLMVKTKDEVRRFVGNGVGRLMALCMPGGTENTRYRECMDAFKHRYAQNMRCKTAPYGGIMELLQHLSDSGYKLAVVSNKFDAAVKGLCGDYFGEYSMAAFGELDGLARKPAPDIVRQALRALGSTPDKSIYVGDSEVDVETAKNAGLTFVGVTWGFRDREILTQAGAMLTVDSPAELMAMLD